MAKTIEYQTLQERDLVERDPRDVLARLIAILEDQNPGFYASGINKLFPPKEGEEHPLSYQKPV